MVGSASVAHKGAFQALLCGCRFVADGFGGLGWSGVFHAREFVAERVVILLVGVEVVEQRN